MPQLLCPPRGPHLAWEPQGLGQNGPSHPTLPAPFLPGKQPGWGWGQTEPALTIWLGEQGQSLSWPTNYLPRPGSRRI